MADSEKGRHGLDQRVIYSRQTNQPVLGAWSCMLTTPDWFSMEGDQTAESGFASGADNADKQGNEKE